MALEEYQLIHAAFDQWLQAGTLTGNQADIEKLKRILPIVLEECCTQTQKTYIEHYFVDGMSMHQISEKYGLCPSTVSRTIKRGLGRAYKYLRFASPLFIRQPQRQGYTTRNGGRPTWKGCAS